MPNNQHDWHSNDGDPSKDKDDQRTSEPTAAKCREHSFESKVVNVKHYNPPTSNLSLENSGTKQSIIFMTNT